jgi:predicted XRE-type DNA-binding protein
MTTTKSWAAVKAEAAAAGTITDEHRRAAAARTEEYVQAYRLTEIRQARQLTQVQLAAAMHVTQPRVSEIEHGEIDAVQLSTLRNYVQALGGHLTVTAEFDNEHITLATG